MRIRSTVLAQTICLFCVPLAARADGTPSPASSLRGQRYCEVLAGGRSGLGISLDVYNTIGLSDCPQESWELLDANRLQEELKVDRVKLNGPRYWTLDAIENARLIDRATRTFGTLPMRKAGILELSFADVSSMGKPYVPHTVRRDTTFLFQSGKPVRELVDPRGRVFVMQSYSVQSVPQTEESLASLGDRLHLPPGWSFRSRVLTADLRVLAVGGHATVIQDENGNTYQLSQQ
jgi:hypothetical protein